MDLTQLTATELIDADAGLAAARESEARWMAHRATGAPVLSSTIRDFPLKRRAQLQSVPKVLSLSLAFSQLFARACYLEGCDLSAVVHASGHKCVLSRSESR